MYQVVAGLWIYGMSHVTQNSFFPSHLFLKFKAVRSTEKGSTKIFLRWIETAKASGTPAWWGPSDGYSCAIYLRYIAQEYPSPKKSPKNRHPKNHFCLLYYLHVWYYQINLAPSVPCIYAFFFLQKFDFSSKWDKKKKTCSYACLQYFFHFVNQCNESIV